MPYASPIYPFFLPTQTPGDRWSFQICHRFAFSRMLYSWTHSVYSLLRLTPFICPEDSFMAWSLICFLGPTTILSSGWATVCLSTYLLEDILVASVWVMMSKAAMNICLWFFCTDIHFQLLWVNPSRAIARSYGKNVFNVMRSHQTVSQGGCTICTSTSDAWDFLLLHNLTSVWCCQCSRFWPSL